MRYAVLIGRILYSFMFLTSGLMGHLLALGTTSQWVASKGIPLPTLAVLISGLMIIAGGLSILLGYKARIGAGLLFVFLVVVAFIIHNFWAIEDEMASQMEMAMFMKNMSMAGAALLIMYFGSGPLSIDKE